MSYISEQNKNAEDFKASLNDNEEINYIVTLKGKPQKHFFKKTKLNLWERIRDDSLTYFDKKGITWHTNNVENNPDTEPEGNMRSSQISWLNHLFY